MFIFLLSGVNIYAQNDIFGDSRYKYFDNSLNMEFDVLRRQDIDDFTGTVLQLNGEKGASVQMIIDWKQESDDSRLMVISQSDVKTYEIGKLKWQHRPEALKVSITLFFKTDKAVVVLDHKPIVINELGLSQDEAYRVYLLPKSSVRPDPNIPPIVEYSGLHYEYSAAKRSGNNIWIWLIAIVIVDLILSFIIFNKRRRRSRLINGNIQEEDSLLGNATENGFLGSNEVCTLRTTYVIPKLPKVSSIFIFGEFRVFDKEGKDISKDFSPMQRDLLSLLIIMSASSPSEGKAMGIFSEGRGVPSSRMKEIFWPDKDLKSAKNNRAVYISKLRAILSRLGNMSIEKVDGCWKLCPGEVFVDYFEFQKIDYSAKVSVENAEKLLSIVQNGPILPEIEAYWLDPCKAESTDIVIDYFTRFAASVKCEDMMDFIIAAADVVFKFDDLNEQALYYKCNSYTYAGCHASAKAVYDSFAERYREIYGRNFQYNFTELLCSKSTTSQSKGIDI